MPGRSWTFERPIVRHKLLICNDEGAKKRSQWVERLQNFDASVTWWNVSWCSQWRRTWTWNTSCHTHWRLCFSLHVLYRWHDGQNGQKCSGDCFRELGRAEHDAAGGRCMHYRWKLPLAHSAYNQTTTNIWRRRQKLLGASRVLVTKTCWYTPRWLSHTFGQGLWGSAPWYRWQLRCSYKKVQITFVRGISSTLWVSGHSNNNLHTSSLKNGKIRLMLTSLALVIST